MAYNSAVKGGESVDTVVISSARTAQELVICFAVISTIPALMILFGHHIGMRGRLPPTALGTAVGIGAVPLFLATLIALMVVGGYFRRIEIDTRGVTMKRAMRAPVRLEWLEIRRIRWVPKIATLQGERATIDIYWDHGRHDGADKLGKDLIARHLQPLFDLSDPPREPQWSHGSLWRVGLASCAFALPIYLMYLAAVNNPAQMRFWALSMMVWQNVPLLWALFLGLHRVYRHPDSPGRWRTRLA